MSFAERLRDQVPKNESVAVVRRTKLQFQAETGHVLAPARQRLLQSGALDIIEELLELVEGSHFELINSLAGSLFALFPKYEGTQLIFRWDKVFDDELDMDFDKSLNITSNILSEGITIRSYVDIVRPRDVMGETECFKRVLTPPEWKNRAEFETAIQEAVTLAGLTQRQLRQPNV